MYNRKNCRASQQGRVRHSAECLWFCKQRILRIENFFRSKNWSKQIFMSTYFFSPRFHSRGVCFVQNFKDRCQLVNLSTCLLVNLFCLTPQRYGDVFGAKIFILDHRKKFSTRGFFVAGLYSSSTCLHFYRCYSSCLPSPASYGAPANSRTGKCPAPSCERQCW